MAADLSIVVKLVDRASGPLGALKGKVGALGAAAGKALRMGALAGAAGLAALGVAAVKMGMDFEKSMAEVRTLLPDISEKGFGDLRNQVLDLSKEMGIATSEMVPALYQAISAGIPPENVIDFMRTGSKAAIGGCADLATTVDGLTTVVNAFGLSADDTGRVADVMFTAVKLGKTTMAELSQSMFQAAPLAASMGLKIEDIAAATATLTKSGTPTSVAMTSIRQAMVALSKPTADMTDLIAKTGFESGEALIKSKGFAGALGVLTEAAGGNKEVMAKAFGSVEALQAVLGLTGENAEVAAADLEAMNSAAGASDEAFKTMEKTASRKLQKAINLLKVELTKLGVKALPVLANALEKAVPWLEKNLPQAIAKVEKFIRDARPHVEKFIGIFHSGLKTLREAFEPLVRWILNNKPALIAAIAAIGVAIVLAFGPAAVAIVAIVGLITLLGLLRENWDEIKAKVNQVIDDVIAKIEGIPIIGEIFKATVRVVQDKIKAVISYIQNLIAFAKELIRFFKAVFSGDWAAAWDSLKEMAKIALNLFLDFLQLTFVGTIRSILRGLGLWDAAKGAFETFKTKASTFLSGVVDTVRGIGSSIAKALGEGLSAAKGYVTGALNAIITAIEKAANFMIRGINRIGGTIGGLGGAVNAVLGFFGAPKIPTIPQIPYVSLPRLEKGGRVLETGLAVVHKGEEFRRGGGGDTYIFNYTHNGALMGNAAEEEQFVSKVDARLRRKWRRQYA